jgi:hypothetical protein
MSVKRIDGCTWVYFRGFIVTANDDGSIPLNSLMVIDLSDMKHSDIREQALRVVEIHNEMLSRLKGIK